MHNEVWTLWSKFDQKKHVESQFDPEIDDESRNGPVLVSGPTSVTLLVLIITQIGTSHQSTEVQHQLNGPSNSKYQTELHKLGLVAYFYHQLNMNTSSCNGICINSFARTKPRITRFCK